MRHIVERMEDVFIGVAASVLLIVSVAVTHESVMRYFFRRPGPYGIEISMLSLLILAYLGAAYTERREGHVRVDLIYSIVSQRAGNLLNITSSFISLIYVIFLTWAAWEGAWQMFTEHWHSDTSLQTPLAPIGFSVVMGLSLFGLAILIRVGKFIQLAGFLGHKELP